MRAAIVALFVSFVLAANLRRAESKKMSFEEIREDLRPVRDVCIKRVGVDPKLVDDTNVGKFVPDRRLMCYFKCLLIMTKVMTKDDVIMETTFIRNMQHMLKEELVKPVMTAFGHCAPVLMKGYEGCELSYELTKCYFNYDPALRLYP